jgi:hypothetical protein
MTGAVAVEAICPGDLDSGVPAHYGDPLREQRLLATGVGLVDRSKRDVIAITGSQRLSWLHSLLTQHLSGMQALSATEALLLTPHGHVESHAVLLDDGSSTIADLEPGSGTPMLDFLHRMKFLLPVQPQALEDWVVLSLAGPGSAAAAAPLAGELAEPILAPVPGAKFTSGTVAAGPTVTYAVTGLAGGGFARRMPYGVDLVLPAEQARDLPARLGVPLAGIWAFEALRVAARQARFGRDCDHHTLPAEVGLLQRCVHLEKGCYRGQESVARVHHLGRPPRRLVLLHLDGVTTDQLPAPGTAVTTVEGRQVGFVGTAVRHFELGSIALAVVKRTVSGQDSLLVGESAASLDPD